MWNLIVWNYLLTIGIFASSVSQHDMNNKSRSRHNNLQSKGKLNYDREDLDDVHGSIGRVKTIINSHNVFRRNFDSRNINMFTEFLQHVLGVLNTYDDADLYNFVDVLSDEIENFKYRGCKFHELSDNKHFWSFVRKKLNEYKRLPMPLLKHRLLSLYSKLEGDLSNQYKINVLNFINSLYKQNSKEKLYNFLTNLYDLRWQTMNSNDLVNMIRNGLRSIIFDHYSQLNVINRMKLKSIVNKLWPSSTHRRSLYLKGKDKTRIAQHLPAAEVHRTVEPKTLPRSNSSSNDITKKDTKSDPIRTQVRNRVTEDESHKDSKLKAVDGSDFEIKIVIENDLFDWSNDSIIDNSSAEHSSSVLTSTVSTDILNHKQRRRTTTNSNTYKQMYVETNLDLKYDPFAYDKFTTETNRSNTNKSFEKDKNISISKKKYKRNSRDGWPSTTSTLINSREEYREPRPNRNHLKAMANNEHFKQKPDISGTVLHEKDIQLNKSKRYIVTNNPASDILEKRTITIFLPKLTSQASEVTKLRTLSPKYVTVSLSAEKSKYSTSNNKRLRKKDSRKRKPKQGDDKSGIPFREQINEQENNDSNQQTHKYNNNKQKEATLKLVDIKKKMNTAHNTQTLNSTKDKKNQKKTHVIFQLKTNNNNYPKIVSSEEGKLDDNPMNSTSINSKRISRTGVDIKNIHQNQHTSSKSTMNNNKNDTYDSHNMNSYHESFNSSQVIGVTYDIEKIDERNQIKRKYASDENINTTITMNTVEKDLQSKFNSYKKNQTNSFSDATNKNKTMLDTYYLRSPTLTSEEKLKSKRELYFNYKGAVTQRNINATDSQIKTSPTTIDSFSDQDLTSRSDYEQSLDLSTETYSDLEVFLKEFIDDVVDSKNVSKNFNGNVRNEDYNLNKSLDYNLRREMAGDIEPFKEEKILRHIRTRRLGKFYNNTKQVKDITKDSQFRSEEESNDSSVSEASPSAAQTTTSKNYYLRNYY